MFFKIGSPWPIMAGFFCFFGVVEGGRGGGKNYMSNGEYYQPHLCKHARSN